MSDLIKKFFLLKILKMDEGYNDEFIHFAQVTQENADLSDANLILKKTLTDLTARVEKNCQLITRPELAPLDLTLWVELCKHFSCERDLNDPRSHLIELLKEHKIQSSLKLASMAAENKRLLAENDSLKTDFQKMKNKAVSNELQLSSKFGDNKRLRTENDSLKLATKKYRKLYNDAERVLNSLVGLEDLKHSLKEALVE